jgi:hypothetical protein
MNLATPAEQEVQPSCHKGMPVTKQKGSVGERVDRLVEHLRQENPALLGVVENFRRLDKLAYKVGLLERSDSYTSHVSWWPLISVLGTFSSGKSTFINRILGQPLQSTGNQAVDDKFTVICFGREQAPRVLPALALDSDPRFPLYRISSEIDEAMHGEGERLDAYLQLKTSASEYLRGKILIDSPGFDADAQRTATLRITSQILDLSDLVLVFFDARHPEPGAMRDTLEYLVAGPLRRTDFNKFLYVLNQIDTAVREDNSEEVFAAWQRALAQKGLTTGRFYTLYDPAAAVPMDDEYLRRRLENKRNQDLREVLGRINQVEVQRAYRIAGQLEQTARRFRDEWIPRLIDARRLWRRRLLWADALVFGLLVALGLVLAYRQGLGFAFPPPQGDTGDLLRFWGPIVVLVTAAFLLHGMLRRWTARGVARGIAHDERLGDARGPVAQAFMRSARAWRPFFYSRPAGWGPGARRRLDAVLAAAARSVQELNDRYTDPSGGTARAEAERRLLDETLPGVERERPPAETIPTDSDTTEAERLGPIKAAQGGAPLRVSREASSRP